MQVVLKECKYIEKKKIVFRHVNDHLGDFSSDESNVCFSCLKSLLFMFKSSTECSFPQSRKFSLMKEFFYSQETFPQKNFTWSRKFFTTEEVFHTKNLLDEKIFNNQENFPRNKFLQTTKFSSKMFSLMKEVFRKQRLLHIQKKIKKDLFL